MVSGIFLGPCLAPGSVFSDCALVLKGRAAELWRVARLGCFLRGLQWITVYEGSKAAKERAGLPAATSPSGTTGLFSN